MCSEVMYGAYYPYLYGRAGPSRPFYQYDRVSWTNDGFTMEFSASANCTKKSYEENRFHASHSCNIERYKIAVKYFMSHIFNDKYMTRNKN